MDLDFGTGALKVTPGHDPTDYEIGERHDLEAVNILNLDGTLNDHAGPYSGLTVCKGSAEVSQPVWKSDGILETS